MKTMVVMMVMTVAPVTKKGKKIQIGTAAAEVMSTTSK
jgi:hypothetical protein